MKKTSRRSFLIQSLAATATAKGVASEAGWSYPAEKRLRVAIIGCGRLGQHYAEIYRALSQTELVAIAEWNPERRRVVGERFQVKALYRDAEAMLKEVVPDLAAIITPTKYMKDAVIACAEAGVKGVQTDRPFAARLCDADEMISTCERRDVVLAGGALERANWQVHEAGRRLQSGEFGERLGAVVHGYRGEILSGGTARILVLQHFTQATVDEVIAWGAPPEALADSATDHGLSINGRFHLTSGLECQVFGSQSEAPYLGVEVWTENALVRWDRHGKPLTQIFVGFDSKGARLEIEPSYAPWPWEPVAKKMETFLTSIGQRGSERDYVLAPVTSLIDAVTKGIPLRISGKDQLHALEVAIASKLSAQRGHVPIKLPLEDRSLALYPRPYRWLGGDVSGRPQSPEEAAGTKR
jgi:predicted dehydrogenase